MPVNSKLSKYSRRDSGYEADSSDSEKDKDFDTKKLIFLEDVRQFHGRRMLEMATLSIESLPDGSRKIDFHFPKTADELKVTTFKISSEQSLKGKMNFIKPEWFSMNACQKTIQEIDKMWLMGRSRIMLTTEEDYQSYLPYFYAATYLIINSQKTVKMSEVLDEMPNLENLILNGKADCTDEDFIRFTTRAKNVRSFSIDLSECSSVSLNALVFFMENTCFAEPARVHLSGFYTTRKTMISALLSAENIENFVIVQKEIRITRKDGVFVTLQLDKCLP